MTRRTIAALAAMALLLAGCGGGGDEGVADQPAQDAATEPAEDTADQEAGEGAAGDTAAGDAVLVQGFRFQPPRLEVAAGTAVSWTNQDDIEHTATAGTPEAPGGEFDVALDTKGAEGSHTFATPGTYAYFCKVHNSMRGEIVVS